MAQGEVLCKTRAESRRMEAALLKLEGIIDGLVIDGLVSDDEIAALVRWIERHAEFAKSPPFDEVLLRLKLILADRVIDQQRRAQILELCLWYTACKQSFTKLEAELLRFQGVVAGIGADGAISAAELSALGAWLDQRPAVASSRPCKEIARHVACAMKDGKVEPAEQEQLMQLFGEFVNYPVERFVDGEG